MQHFACVRRFYISRLNALRFLVEIMTHLYYNSYNAALKN